MLEQDLLDAEIKKKKRWFLIIVLALLPLVGLLSALQWIVSPASPPVALAIDLTATATQPSESAPATPVPTVVIGVASTGDTVTPSPLPELTPEPDPTHTPSPEPTPEPDPTHTPSPEPTAVPDEPQVLTATITPAPTPTLSGPIEMPVTGAGPPRRPGWTGGGLVAVLLGATLFGLGSALDTALERRRHLH